MPTHIPQHQRQVPAQTQQPANPNQLMLEQMVQAMGQQQQLAQQAPQPRTGFLAPGQEGARDVLTNPSQEQLTAALTGLLHAANPNSRSPLLSGFAGGASALQSQRAREYETRKSAYDAQTKELQQRIENLGRAAGVSDQIQGRGMDRERLNLAYRGEERASGPQERVDLVDASGQVQGEVLVGPNQQLFDIDPQTGQPVNITQQVRQQGLRTKPKSSQTINVDARQTGDDLRDMVDKQAVERLDKLREQEQAGRQKVVLSNQMLDLAPQVNSGVGAQVLTDFKSLASTGLREAGLESLAGRFETANAEQMGGLAGQAMMPFIEAQGRSFSDQDRKATERMIAGLRNTPKANVALGNLMKASGLAEQEEFYFQEEVVRRAAAGEREDTFGASREFSQYVQDVPRLKVNSEGIPTAVDDSRNLWKYWVGGRPQRFVLQTPDGTREMKQEELRAIATEAGITYRELLSVMDRKGQILGAQRNGGK